MTAPELSPEAVETLAEAMCDFHDRDSGREPDESYPCWCCLQEAGEVAPTVAALIAQHVEAARADEAQRVRERVEAIHIREPADSPFNREGRDVCSVCMDGQHPADWPCATLAALATPDPEAAGPRLTEGCKCGKYTTGWLGDRNALNVDGEHHGSKACDV